ncbi:MAG: LytTR family transcriptional regulator DNA-binding domain-containing protein [Lachnospiraceae bacterium]|nr:LytTR family transcriptional regulator DNA-binding domain-containing protein [Lachnospiraceae bacterium]
MKIKVETVSPTQEEEIILRVQEQRLQGAPEEIRTLTQRIAQALRSEAEELVIWKDEAMYRIKLKDIYYFEVMERRSFVYGKEDVYETKLKLYEFEEKTRGTSFFRASKSMVLNADRIDYVKPSLSGRLEAVLFNGEKVMVSRQYASQLKKLMGLQR